GIVTGVIIAPSLLAADPKRFGEELSDVEKAGADWHHVDVMDGHFVPNLTYGIPLVRALKKSSRIPLDVHIMVSNPDQVALDYVEAGADILVFHVEAAVHPHRLIQAIHAKGAKAGIAVNPGTSLSLVEPLVPYVDLINVMSVNPGFGGQSFIPESLERIRAVKKMLEARGRVEQVYIQVDGGINAETVDSVVNAGANFLVAGTYFYGAPDRKQALRILRGEA
ncbi:MAG: ribulose-phosphate 3-epimerase, partial [Pseudobdellovibrionaceae bacterium]|nr:ribulose-phosphate 3-epimerase [Pseudobdellovibrionaceae bacterium]